MARKHRPSEDTPSRWNDLAYGIVSGITGALTSGKFWMTLLAVGFAVWNYERGDLSATALQAAITTAAAVYLGVDAVQNFGVKREAQRTETERETRLAMEHRLSAKHLDREAEIRAAHGPARLISPVEAPR